MVRARRTLTVPDDLPADGNAVPFIHHTRFFTLLTYNFMIWILDINRPVKSVKYFNWLEKYDTPKSTLLRNCVTEALFFFYCCTEIDSKNGTVLSTNEY